MEMSVNDPGVESNGQEQARVEAGDHRLDSIPVLVPEPKLVLDSSSELDPFDKLRSSLASLSNPLKPRGRFTRNPRNGSRNRGNFSAGSQNQLLPKIRTKDCRAGSRASARQVSSHCARPAETYTARTGSLLGSQWPGNDQRSSTARMQSQ